MSSKRHVSITSFGAIGDGSFDNTLCFQEAFKDPGVVVEVPSGLWLTGPIKINSNSSLIVSSGALIKFIADPEKYSPVYSRWEGVRCWAMHPCIYSEKSENISIEGEGTIDGSGQWWWQEALKRKKEDSLPQYSYEKRLATLNPDFLNQPGGGGGRKSQFLRPPLVQFNNSKNVTIRGVKLINSPFWTLHPLFSKGVTIENITIDNPYDSPNTDAIDIDSCSNVTVRGCYINVGDDGICLKSGAGEDGIECNIPTTNVRVDSSTVSSAHGGAVIGSETASGINNVIFTNCNFIGTDRGIRVKTRRGRGGNIENIEFSNINIDGCLSPITFNMYYRCGATDSALFSLNPEVVTRATPSIKNITISNVRAKNCKSSAGFFVGLPEAPLKNIVIKNSMFSVDEFSPIKPKESEMYLGLDDIEDKAIRVKFASVEFENVIVEGVKKVVVEG